MRWGTWDGPSARSLVNGGHDLTVHDLRTEAADELVSRGAELATGLQQVARASAVVFTSLPGPAEVEEAACTTRKGRVPMTHADAILVL